VFDWNKQTVYYCLSIQQHDGMSSKKKVQLDFQQRLTSKTEEKEEQYKDELTNPAVRYSCETDRFSAGHEISNILW